MKLLGLIGLTVCLAAIVSHAGTGQDEARIQSTPDLKQVATTLPSGEPILMSALNIDRTWSDSVTHLKGNVRVEVRETLKAGNRYLLVRADEATYNPGSGEIIPSGNVRITQEYR